MSLTRVKLEQFTAFSNLDMEFSPGLNVLLGENGTGKTHVMKVCYAACASYGPGFGFGTKLAEIFMPRRGALGRLVRRRMGGGKALVEVYRGERKLVSSFSNQESGDKAFSDYDERWADDRIPSVYIPTGDPLAAGQWLWTLYEDLYEHQEIYWDRLNRSPLDIFDWAIEPPLRGTRDKATKKVIDILQKAVGGKVSLRNEELYLDFGQGNLEFSLLSDGVRKLALLLVMARNGTLRKGAALFWEHPEASLNPKMFGAAIEALLELQRMGVQVFFATHSYGVLKELDLRMEERDNILFHTFYRDDESGEIAHRSVGYYLGIHPNSIWEAFDDLYDRELTRSLKEPAP